MPTDLPATAADFDPTAPGYVLDPQGTAQALFAHDSVVHCPPLGAYFVAGYDAAREVLTDFDTYSSHAFKGLPVRADLRDRIPEEWERVGQVIQGGQLINMDPPVHTAQRRAIQQTFTRKRVNAVKPEIATIAHDLVDGIADRGECDLMQDVALQLTVRVVGSMLALPADMIPGFLAWIGDVFAVLAPIDLRPEDVTFPDDQLVATFERLYLAQRVYVDLLDERRAHPGDDLASAMLALTDEAGAPLLTSEQVLGHMVGITAAGTDTTAALITNMVRFLTEHPDQLAYVLADPDRWDNAIQEGLRRSCVALHAGRITTRDTELGGVAIPARSNVFVGLAAANADPARFPDPLRFDVTRANAREHLALGVGRHFCLGAPLAPPEVRIALETLYARLPGLRADLDQELEFVPSPVVRVMLSQRASW
jgi:cytochrome P450